MGFLIKIDCSDVVFIILCKLFKIIRVGNGKYPLSFLEQGPLFKKKQTKNEQQRAAQNKASRVAEPLVLTMFFTDFISNGLHS